MGIIAVVAGGKAAKVFEFVEAALDAITIFVKAFAVSIGLLEV